jgi:hypothetical protein
MAHTGGLAADESQIGGAGALVRIEYNTLALPVAGKQKDVSLRRKLPQILREFGHKRIRHYAGTVNAAYRRCPNKLVLHSFSYTPIEVSHQGPRCLQPNSR